MTNGTQISDMTDSLTDFPDEAFVPFVVETTVDGLSSSNNYRYRAGQYLAKLSSLAASDGSTLIGFIQSGTGAVQRTAQSKMRDWVSVLDFMGVLTTTAAFQAAAATGKHVYVPSGTYPLTGPVSSAAAGQRFFGDGGTSQVTSIGENANANVLQLIHEGCSVENISLTPGTELNALAQGFGVQITADNCTISSITVSGMRRGGVHISNANGCIVETCTFIDSVVVTTPEDPLPQSETGYDVYVSGTSSGNTVQGNQCISGAGVGVALQTSIPLAPMFRNSVIGNTIQNQPVYGIMQYGTYTTSQVFDTVITGNNIYNVSGSIYIDGSSYFYGAGIYMASADRFVCTGNIVRATNTDTSLPHTSGTPAAISSTGYGTGTIADNQIDDCYYGIWLTQGSTTNNADTCVIGLNRITNSRASGIYLPGARSAVIRDNSICGKLNLDGTPVGNRGVLINNSPAVGYSFDVSGNHISGYNNGVEVIASPSFVRVSTNTIRNCDDYGIYAEALDVQIANNNIVMNNGQLAAIRYTPAATSGTCLGNELWANVTGITAGSAAVLLNNNTLNGVPILPADYADDAAAAAGGIAIGHYYRTGSIIKRRVS